MQILKNLSDYCPDPARPLVLTMGNFDGIHLGHQKLIARTVEEARRRRGLAAVLTYRNHPQSVLQPNFRPLILTQIPYRMVLLEKTGVDLCFLLSFDEEFAKLEPDDFVRDVLVRKLNVQGVKLGFNSRFGHHRRGDTGMMAALSREYGFEFEEIEGYRIGEKTVSSSLVRTLVQQACLEEAGKCLGKPFSLTGKVIRGDGRGKELGFPTANLDIGLNVMPPTGVYAVRLREIDREGEMARPCSGWFKGALNYGRRPTFKEGPMETQAEVFVLDGEADWYGKNLEVIVIKRLRDEKKFDSQASLKAQIADDVRAVREALSN